MDALSVRRDGDVATITLTRPERRNVLALDVLEALADAFREVGRSDARGVVLAAEGPVFSAGHDFADMADADLATARHLFRTCTDLMETVQAIPQPVVARVHALATAAGCQLVATCDLAVAAESAGFALPGGRGGLFCHTPAVAVARAVGQKRALEMALTGDVVPAATAAAWGLVNRCVPDDELDAAVADLLARATRGGRESKGLGKQAFYAQVGRPQDDAYTLAVEVMAAATQTPDAREGIAAFLEKRPPAFP
ncbi:MAG TPA: enoyl-CoA hydratase-related protein [Iamia sp.]|nr:enoyl-CoA hydratase-related protein [Iamia sp.]